MKKALDLKMPGVMELGREELQEVNGGGKIGDALRDAWDWTKNAAEDVWDWTVRQVAGLSELV